jgi:hypothetical protein
MTKYHRLGCLNERNLLFMALKTGDSKINVPAWLGSGYSCFPDLERPPFVCVHTWQRTKGMERAQKEAHLCIFLLGQ